MLTRAFSSVFNKYDLDLRRLQRVWGVEDGELYGAKLGTRVSLPAWPRRVELVLSAPRALLAAASAAYPVFGLDVLAVRARAVVVVDLGFLGLRGVERGYLQRDHLLPITDSLGACDSRQRVPQGLDDESDVVLWGCNDASRVLQASIADSRRPGDSPASAFQGSGGQLNDTRPDFTPLRRPSSADPARSHARPISVPRPFPAFAIARLARAYARTPTHVVGGRG